MYDNVQLLRKLLEEFPQEFKEASEEVIIGIPEYEKKFISEYRLPNNSITIGKCSEFWVGKCKFGVLEVEPRRV